MRTQILVKMVKRGIALLRTEQKDLVPDRVRLRVAMVEHKIATSKTLAPVERVTIDQIFSRVQAGYYRVNGIKNPEDVQ